MTVPRARPHESCHHTPNGFDFVVIRSVFICVYEYVNDGDFIIIIFQNMYGVHHTSDVVCIVYVREKSETNMI